ncbi:SDR family oxidoreductase [Methylobacterium sp. W2]|uniref:SDR family oxidoreductase n=1 Tax=Methylobacterium sp. W2 TaxID=2598107 RepID=UPI001D0C47AB
MTLTCHRHTTDDALTSNPRHRMGVGQFGSKVPFGRQGQPADLASAYVMLASDKSSYTPGSLVTVAGRMPVL